MIEYTKIDTPFNRDMEGTKKLIEGDYKNDALRFLANLTWVGTEKIDGTNISVVWDGHKVEFHGRTEKAQIQKELLEYLEGTFGGNTNEELFEQLFGEKHVILFGEGYGGKIQSGGKYRPDCAFILFDIYMPENNLWLKRDAIEDIAKAFSIEKVPILIKGTLSECIEYVKGRPFSRISIPDNTVIEGIVCKPEIDLFDRMGRRIITKIKVCDFT